MLTLVPRTRPPRAARVHAAPPLVPPVAPVAHLRAARSGVLRPLVARVLVGGVLAGGLLAVPGAASAHVRVIADNPTVGSYSQLTFRVPTESATAGTVKVQVTLPTDRPLLHVSTRPVPGWTATVTEKQLPTPVDADGTTITKAPGTVTWAADDPANAIKPGEYQEFAVSAGPLRGVGELLLPATQTYSDGTAVAWDEPPPAAGGAEPEHPAPVLTVAAAAGGEAGAPTSAASSPTTEGPAPDWVARGLGLAGLVIGAAGVVVAGLALRRGRGSA